MSINVAQFGFQNRHARGRILNVGSNNDAGGLSERGAVNVDLHRVSPATAVPNVVNVLADARALPFRAAFDTVVLGDILEHLNATDILLALCQAQQCLKPHGRIVITCPNDTRSINEQRKYGEDCEYAPGIWALHHGPMPIDLLSEIIRAAGLRVVDGNVIDYPHFTGWGLVAEC